MVELLLKHGAYCNAKDAKKWTPLHKAAFKNYANIADILVKSGAWIKAKDFEGKTPLDIALLNGSKEVVEYLRSVPYVRPAVMGMF